MFKKYTFIFLLNIYPVASAYKKKRHRNQFLIDFFVYYFIAVIIFTFHCRCKLFPYRFYRRHYKFIYIHIYFPSKVSRLWIDVSTYHQRISTLYRVSKFHCGLKKEFKTKKKNVLLKISVARFWFGIREFYLFVHHCGS